MATGAIGRSAATRSQFRLPAQVSTGYVSQSAPTVASPSLPPAVVEGQYGPQTQPRLETRAPHQSAHHGYRRRGIRPEWRRVARRDRSLGRALNRRREAPSEHSVGERNASISKLAPGEVCAKIAAWRNTHVAARSRRGGKCPSIATTAGGSPRISYRAKCIAQKSPSLQRHRSQRQGAFAIPPPGAGVRGLPLPIWADRRSPLTTASSRGGAKRPSNASAAGDENSASVSASWLATPRYPGQNGDGAPRRVRSPARIA